MKLRRRDTLSEAPEEYFDSVDDEAGMMTLVIPTERWEELERPEVAEVEVSFG